jgi:Flp pilus assembly protein TadD
MTRKYRQFDSSRQALALCLAVALGACANTPQQSPDIAALNNHPGFTVPQAEFLRVSPEMREFAETHAVRRGMNGRAWSLTYAALDPYVLDFDYDPQVTLTADQAFRDRKGNCLTFSGMFIAMARDAGLTAWYQEIEIQPTWSSVNDTLLVSKHVNAVVQGSRRQYTVDISRLTHDDNLRSRRLTDLEAAAQYYNNLGADALIENDLGRAHAYFKKALGTQPRLAYVWSNLGVVYRRNFQTADAITAYRFALQLEPGQTVALNNLFLIYEEEGDVESAAEIQRRVETNRRKNPYYLHSLAETANMEGRYGEAIKWLGRAIRIEDQEYRFHYTLAQSLYFSGDRNGAQASLDRAKQLAPFPLEDSLSTLPHPELVELGPLR